MAFPAPGDYEPAGGQHSVVAGMRGDALRTERYLKALAERVELRQFSAPPSETKLQGEALARDLGLLGVRSYYIRGDAPVDTLPGVAGLQLHALQAFVNNFMNPAAGNSRLLLCWDTGTGKTIAAITIAQRFAALFRSYKLLPPEARPTIFIIGFTRSVIQAEMLRDPRHGFITYNELNELRRLKEQAKAAIPGSPSIRQFYGYVGTLKRALTDRLRGGYYRFFGYKEFAAQLLAVTARGEREGVRVLDLFLRPEAAGGADDQERGQMAVFARRIAEFERRGLLRVNNELLAQMRRGLIVADEIHNVYNIHDPNMYGVAIQFALDAFPPEEAPRAIFMSATPMSGSPAEIVDLLNLLVPRTHLPDQRPLEKKDFFTKITGAGLAKLALKPGADDRISTLATGRVSFLTVEMERSSEMLTGEQAFPERVFVGAEVDEASAEPGRSVQKIPFLKFVVCPLAPAHQEALLAWAHARAEARKVKDAASPRQARSDDTIAFTLPAAADYSLYDMVFPNPVGGTALYSSPAASTIYSTLARADPAWLSKNKIAVIAETAASGRNAPVISGEFLNLEQANGIRNYSGKFSKFVEDVVSIITAKRAGKMLVYHDRVQLTGVAFLAELLRHNGFIDLTEPPHPATRCAVCGVALRQHKAASAKMHDYSPARYAVVAGTMDRSSQERTLGQFNRPSNIDGLEIRVLLGSMVIVEGLDFKAVRFQFLLSIARNIPMLIQILGRSHRRGAHAGLPAEERKVETRIYLNGSAKGTTQNVSPPDLVKLTRNMWEYQLILVVLSALRRPGINGFLAQSRVLASKKPSLEGLPFQLPVTAAQVADLPTKDDSYYAYGASVADLLRLKDGVRALFARRPVWTKEELIAALTTPGVILGLAGDPSQTPIDQVELALAYLTRPPPESRAESRASGEALAAANIQILVGDSQEYRRLTAIPVTAPDVTTIYYVALPVTVSATGETQVVADVESFLRPSGGPHNTGRRVNLRTYADRHLKNINFEKRLAGFKEQFAGASPGTFRQMFVDYGSEFHYPLLDLITTHLAGRRKLDASLDGAYKLYLRYKVFVTAGQLRRARGFEGLAARVATRDASAVVGYIHEDSARIYAPGRGRSLPGEPGSRVVDLYVQRDTTGWHSVPLSVIGRGSFRSENSLIVGYMEVRSGGPRFKIREPRQVLEKRRVRDIRSLARGAVCETRKRADQIALARKLTQRPRAEVDQLSTPEICVLIRDQLLAEEEKARGGRDGLERGTRWFYLFNERLPVLTAVLERPN
jgi:hypothetical protein